MKIALAAILLFALGLAALLNPVYVELSGAEASSDWMSYFPYIASSQGGDAYYISPNGNDNNSGTSPSKAWATFDHANSVLEPGDTLILMDGVYYDSFDRTGGADKGGTPGNPITIRALNDGKAIIDGEGKRIPVFLTFGSYYIFEGIIARNSVDHVWKIQSDHNIFRRVSGYNANTDANAHVFVIKAGVHNLLEDCIASGTGRKMILLYHSEYNTVRRCFADWRQWDARDVKMIWPWGEGIEIYGADHSIIENSIAYGHVPRAGISLLSQGNQTSNGNKILGTMSISAGMKEDGTPMFWGPDPNNPPFTQLQPLVRPQPTEGTKIQKFDEYGNLLAGIRIGGNGTIRDSLLQDVFAWGSARYGLSVHKTPDSIYANNRVNRATVYNNGLTQIEIFGGIGAGASQVDLSDIDSIENSYIENVWSDPGGFFTITGEGARLTHRYIDGVLTNEPLWPWPMEDRIQAELGISVTDMMTGIIFGGDSSPNADLSEGANTIPGIPFISAPSQVTN